MEPNKKQLSVVKGKLTKAVNIANEIKINSQEDYDEAGKKYIEVKKLQKEFVKEKKSWLDPINLLRNKVFDISRPIEAKFEAALKSIDKSLKTYEEKVEAERKAEAKKLEEEAEAKRLEAEAEAKKGAITKEEAEQKIADATADAAEEAGKLQTVEHVSTDKGKMFEQVRHDLVLEDEAKVDRQFLVVDMSKVKTYYNETGLIPAGFKLEKRVIRVVR